MPKKDVRRKIYKTLMHNLNGYSFKNIAYLEQAFLRTSAVNERMDQTKTDNQSLEFLGDRILGVAIAKLLIKTHPKYDPLQLQPLFVALTRNDGPLLEISQKLDLARYIVRGRGEGITNKILADTMEALLGAIYLDSDHDKAVSKIIKTLWQPYLLQLASAGPLPPIQVQAAPAEAKLDSMPVQLQVDAARAAARQSAARTQAVELKEAEELSPRSKRLFTRCELAQYSKHIQKARNINVQNIGVRGDTPIMMYLRPGKTKSLVSIEKRLPMIQALHQAGASLDLPNRKGETARTLIASSADKTKIMQALKL